MSSSVSGQLCSTNQQTTVTHRRTSRVPLFVATAATLSSADVTCYLSVSAAQRLPTYCASTSAGVLPKESQKGEPIQQIFDFVFITLAITVSVLRLGAQSGLVMSWTSLRKLSPFRLPYTYPSHHVVPAKRTISQTGNLSFVLPVRKWWWIRNWKVTTSYHIECVKGGAKEQNSYSCQCQPPFVGDRTSCSCFSCLST